MTHSGGKPHAVGDKGQRYEVRATGVIKEGEEHVIGWSDKLETAVSLRDGILLHPCATSAKIFDRQENKKVITRFTGNRPGS
jgi:hypothetical protein